jgi:endonuclease YncB( thermonuclease family)
MTPVMPDGRRDYRYVNIEERGSNLHGRPIVHFYINGLDLHLKLLRLGLAIVDRTHLPSDLDASYIAAEADARRGKHGLWRRRLIEPSNWCDGERQACER